MPDPPPITAHFFYDQNCHECQKALPFVEALQARHPEIPIEHHDISLDPADRDLLFSLAERYNLSYMGVPTLIVGSEICRGDAEIEQRGDELLRRAAATGVDQGPPAPASPSGPSPLSVTMVLGAALVDGLSPCAIGVLVLLLVSLSATKRKRTVALAGAGYIFMVFIFYLASGLGLFLLIRTAGISRYFSLLSGAIAVAAGLAMMIEARTGLGPRLAIPQSAHGVIRERIERAAIPAACVLGLLVGLFELPCTGGIYLAILGLLAGTSTLSDGLGYLVLYNLGFVLPLVLVLAAVLAGLSPFGGGVRIPARIGDHLRFGMGLVILALGLYILYTFTL